MLLKILLVATPEVYSHTDYNSTPGYRGWTYLDSLGQPMVWDSAAARWTCFNPADQWCYWAAPGGHPGADRNITRRWTAPAAGSARITGTRKKDTNVCGGNLISVGRPSTQSSCVTGCWGGVPSRCNDGNTDGNWANGSVCHTNFEAQPFYQIDLEAPHLINRIEVWNRSDNSGANEPGRTTNFNVMTSLTGQPGSWISVNHPGTAQFPTTINYGFGMTARFVRVQLVGTNYLNLGEVLVYGDGPDGVRTYFDYQSTQANYYRTYTTPGPALNWSAWLGDSACSDDASYSFDWDMEVYPGDTISFNIDRRNNYSWDSTTLAPTITFERTDAIGSLETYSTTSPTSVTIAFNGALKCPNGQTCFYWGDQPFPPDYYTVQPLGFFNNPSQPITTLNNWALCGPSDGPFCLNPAPPYFSRTYSGLSPNSAYKFKVKAYRNGYLYGRTQIITLTTGAIAPPTLSPAVAVVGPTPEYGARDVVISWPEPAAPLNRPAAFERFELYRQAMSSRAPFNSNGAVQGTGTGEQLCAALPYPGDYTCISSTAPGGLCSTNFTYGNATCVLWDPPVRIGYSEWENNNVMQRWVNTADQASPTRRTDLSTGLVTSVTDPGVDRKPTTYRYFLVARYKPAYASPIVRSELTAKIALPRAATIAGFADAHVHQFGNLAHGGTILDGRPGDADDGSETFDGTPVDMGGFTANASGPALRGCGAVSGGGTGNHDLGSFGNFVLDLTPYAHDRSGIKELPKWIDHKNSLHQQAYKTGLKRAVDGGMRLMVMHAVNSEFVCKAVAFVRGNNGFSPIPCDDATALDRQIEAAYRLQSEIDLEYCPGAPIPTIGLPNTHLSNEGSDYECGWYRIVTTPAAARKVMQRGKLAVVLGIEAATPFGCDTGATGPWAGGNASNWANVPGTRSTCMVGGGPVSGIVDILDPLDGASLQYFYNRGVRHVFPIHGINNGLGSTALSTASQYYGPNEAAFHGAYFRPGVCLDRGAAFDGPLTYNLSSINATTLTLPLGIGTISLTNLVGIPFAPAGYPFTANPTCNDGGPVGSTAPPFGLTPLGRSVIQEMMKRRMIIDVDHMSERSHMDMVAESAKSFNYPIVAGHTTLQRLSTGTDEAPGANEVALSTPELEEVRASGGQVYLVALGAFPTLGVASHTRLGGRADDAEFMPRVTSVANDCNNSTKPWAQQYLAAVDLTRNAPMPNDNSAPGVYSVGFGSDINTISTLLQPRFGQVGGLWSGCSAFETAMNLEQEAQWNANVAGGVGRAVQYDVDMISGMPTTKGYGGIDTSLAPGGDTANNFPGFNGPRLRRSRLNEGGYLFTLYGPDKPVDGAPLGSVQTMCLDHGGHVDDGDAAAISDCGNTQHINHQWEYDPAPSRRIRPWIFPDKELVVKIPLSPVNGNNEYEVTFADSNVFTDYDHPAPEATWTTWPSGQLYNALTGRCLSVENSGFGNGNRVVMAPCTGGNTGLALRPDQIWARGGEEESFNLTGLSHIGMYPDMIQDLKNLGLTDRDLIPLFHSAEGYLQTWERTGWTKAIDYTELSSSGVWKYTTAAPATGWREIDFDDTTWRVVHDDNNALGAYGVWPWFNDVFGFPNPTPARWMPVADGSNTHYFRRTFVSDAVGIPKTVTISCDDTASIYFDGVHQLTTGPWNVAASFTFATSSFGTHVIAVECTNSGGPGGLLVDVR